MDSSSGSGNKNSLKGVKIYKLGEKESGIRLQGAVQDFYQECLFNEKLFGDPEFPAEDSYIFALERIAEFQSQEIVWKRSVEIAANPELFVEGTLRFDLKQGRLGNCWMIAALANLAMHTKLIYQVVPQDQSFQEDHAGIFHFRNSVSCDSSGSEDIDGYKPVKIYKLGEKGSGIRLQGAVQDFNQLKRECLANGNLFEDPEFPAEDSSLFLKERPADYEAQIGWVRPSAIAKNPQLFVKGPSRFDVTQGRLTNCWMIAALANLAMRRRLLYQVVPQDQSFQEDYAGIFHFRFWQFGKWIDVVIDDRLPVVDGNLFYAHSKTKNEFWAALLEKAYAKLHGCWEALGFGYNSQALEDFTGGIANSYPLEKAPVDLFDILLEAQERNSLLGCVTNEASDTIEEYRKSHGIISPHAYSITKVMYLDGKILNQVERIPLLRLRNPWGCKEWKGPWSERSSEWNSIPEDEKKEMGFISKEDGEFWISFQDWKKNFTRSEICYLNPRIMMSTSNDTVEQSMKTSTFEGEWVRGASAGGSTDDLKKFQYNPQYRITLKEESMVIVALMQKNRRTQRSKGSDFLRIGFNIYKLPKESVSELSKPLDIAFFKHNKPLQIDKFVDSESSSELFSYTAYRQTCCRIKLQPGVYFIVPSTKYSGEEGEFLLRVFSVKPNNMEEYDVQVGLCDIGDTVREKAGLTEDEVQLRSVFRKYAGDDWEFDWKEHKEILDSKLSEELSERGFSKDACRSMVALLDADYSGKIGYHEFKTFWDCVKIWKSAFNLYDKNGSHFVEPFQLRNVLRSAGFRLNNRILNLLIRRYGRKDGNVKFHDYVMCALRLKKIIGSYDEIIASGGINTDSSTLENWIKITLNL